MASEYLEHKLALLPDKPGCYLMKNINGQIIYVGKAKNLKNRVRSYFKSSHTGKVAKMVSEVADFETIVTSTNKDSFLLEITLIQKHQPYFNIKLKRGTGYPYIKITNERDPQIKITGKIKKDIERDKMLINKLNTALNGIKEDRYYKIIPLIYFDNFTIEQIEENVAKPLEDSKNQKYIDAIGEMYTEFLRYANNEAKLGIVLTPPHITEFMCDLIDINKNDVVIDICCGTAGFLIAAMTKMIKDYKNDSEKIDYIKKNQIIGIEEKSNIHALGCANMILHGDGKSHIIQLDCFKASKNKYLHGKKITKALLNPPYKAKESPAKQLEFVEKSLELLEPNGKCAAIVQMSCAIKNDNKVKQMKSKILSKHTLEAVVSMPDDLFYPVGVVTCIMIFTAHIKHSKNHNTWFGYLKDDGFEKRKHKGRVDLKNKWKDIKDYFIHLLKNKQEKVGISIQHHVEDSDEWCAEAYMETDYSTLTEKDFENTIKKYLSFYIMNGSIDEKN